MSALSPQVVDKMRALRLDGWGIDAIAAEMRVHRTTVSERTRGLVESPHLRRTSTATRERIARMIDAGRGDTSIAREVGVCPNTIAYHRKKLRTLRTPSAWCR